MEIDAHVALSRTGQWLFLLQGESPLKQDKGAKRQCHGYWFMLEAEAIEMETAMEDVVRSLQLRQVWGSFPSLCAHHLLPLTPPPIPHRPAIPAADPACQGMPVSPVKRGSSVRPPPFVRYLYKPLSVVQAALMRGTGRGREGDIARQHRYDKWRW